jgi:hypothetical protein
MENKETLEEAAEKTFTPAYTNYKVRRHGFIEGAKWQAKRSYSEEEVLNILQKVEVSKTSILQQGINGWFEQFKKK